MAQDQPVMTLPREKERTSKMTSPPVVLVRWGVRNRKKFYLIAPPPQFAPNLIFTQNRSLGSWRAKLSSAWPLRQGLDLDAQQVETNSK